MHVDAKYVNLDYDFTAPPPSLLFPSQTNGSPKHSVLTAAQLSTVSQTTTKQPLSPLSHADCAMRGRSGSKDKAVYHSGM